MRFLLLFLLVPGFGYSQSDFDFRIFLNVSGDNGVNTMLENQLNKELRHYEDMVFSTEKNYQYFLDVMIIDVYDGYVATYLLTDKIDPLSVIDNLWALKAKRDSIPEGSYFEEMEDYKARLNKSPLKNVLLYSFQDGVYIIGYSLLVDSDIKSISERIISGIDYSYFRELRPMYERLRDIDNN